MSDDLQRIRADLDRLSRSSVDEIRSQQDRRLAEIVRFHFNNERNTSYRTLLNAHGIKDEAELPRTVDDIGRLPMISRQFLEAADYSRRPCVPFEDVRKIVETTGTSGSPLRVPHTRESMRETSDDLPTPIRRARIHHDVLDVRIVLGEHRRDCPRKVAGLVE